MLSSEPAKAGADAGATRRSLRRAPSVLWWVIFVAGLALSVSMVWRSQVGGDQQQMLYLGWHFLNGDWLQYGMPTSAGGRSPGGAIGVLVGAPLVVWTDYRAPAVAILLAHAVAFLLLARTVWPALTTAGRWLLLPVVWLNPWRLYFSTHIWNANWMFPLGVLHFVTAAGLRARPVGWITFVHVVVVGISLQVHSSFAILAVLTALSIAFRLIHVHKPAFVLGAVVSLALLMPWALAVAEDPSLLPSGRGYPFRGLLLVLPLLRGLLVWLRYGSLAVPERIIDFGFADVVGTGLSTALEGVAWCVGFLGYATFLLPVAANASFVRRIFRRRPWRLEPTDRPREWLWRFLVGALVAATIAFAASPTTAMFWQGFVLLYAPLLVLVTYLEALLRTRHRRIILRCLAVSGVLLVALVLFLAFGGPFYRCGGLHHGLTPTPAAEALGVPLACGPE